MTTFVLQNVNFVFHFSGTLIPLHFRSQLHCRTDHTPNIKWDLHIVDSTCNRCFTEIKKVWAKLNFFPGRSVHEYIRLIVRPPSFPFGSIVLVPGIPTKQLTWLRYRNHDFPFGLLTSIWPCATVSPRHHRFYALHGRHCIWLIIIWRIIKLSLCFIFTSVRCYDICSPRRLCGLQECPAGIHFKGI